MSETPSFCTFDHKFQGYYEGLPSHPKLIARSSTSDWDPPDSISVGHWPAKKGIFPVSPSHPVSRVWDCSLGQQLLHAIDKHTTNAVSVDVVKIGWVEDNVDSAPVILWIGVLPNTVSYSLGDNIVKEAVSILASHDIVDVEVEIRETEVIQTSGPHLLDMEDLQWNSPDFRPLSIASGLAITLTSKKSHLGTGSFYLTNEDDRSTPLLLTAGHVLANNSEDIGVHTGLQQPLEAVQISEKMLGDSQARLRALIRQSKAAIKSAETNIAVMLDGEKSQRAALNLRIDQQNLEDFESAHENLSSWMEHDNRVIGQVYCRPKVTFAPSAWIEDWALIKLDLTKFPPSIVNFLDLRNRADFNLASSTKEAPPLALPAPGCLKLKGVISSQEMTQGSIAVLMAGSTSGLRLGYSMPIPSMVNNVIRQPCDQNENPIRDLKRSVWSRVWGITAVPGTSFKTFIEKGDSGAGVVSRNGKIGGIVTGGSGRRNGPAGRAYVDLTYVTPMWHILDSMQEAGVEDPQFL